MERNRTAAALATVSILLVVACTSATGPATPALTTTTPSPAAPASSQRSRPTSSPSSAGTVPATAQPTTTALQILTRHPVHFGPSVTLDAQLDWHVVDDSSEVYVLAAPHSLGTIVLQANPVIGSDENDCEGLAAAGGATTVNGIVASLSMNPKLVTSNPHAMTIGGLAGQAIDLELDPEWTGTCKWSGGQPASLILTTRHPPGPFNGIVDTERWRLVLLDLGDDVVSIIVSTPDAAMFDTVMSQAMPIVESVRFTLNQPSETST
jgi:hypothetical protein